MKSDSAESFQQFGNLSNERYLKRKSHENLLVWKQEIRDRAVVRRKMCEVRVDQPMGGLRVKVKLEFGFFGAFFVYFLGQQKVNLLVINRRIGK